MNPAFASSSVRISTQRTVSRRRFLRGAGVAMSLPFLDSMLPAFARAGTAPEIGRAHV